MAVARLDAVDKDVFGRLGEVEGLEFTAPAALLENLEVDVARDVEQRFERTVARLLAERALVNVDRPVPAVARPVDVERIRRLRETEAHARDPQCRGIGGTPLFDVEARFGEVVVERILPVRAGEFHLRVGNGFEEIGVNRRSEAADAGHRIGLSGSKRKRSLLVTVVGRGLEFGVAEDHGQVEHRAETYGVEVHLLDDRRGVDIGRNARGGRVGYDGRLAVDKPPDNRGVVDLLISGEFRGDLIRLEIRRLDLRRIAVVGSAGQFVDIAGAGYEVDLVAQDRAFDQHVLRIGERHRSGFVEGVGHIERHRGINVAVHTRDERDGERMVDIDITAREAELLGDDLVAADRNGQRRTAHLVVGIGDMRLKTHAAPGGDLRARTGCRFERRCDNLRSRYGGPFGPRHIGNIIVLTGGHDAKRHERNGKRHEYIPQFSFHNSVNS